ncbi:MAG: DUF4129 domain-containing protein, partial [Microbacteriaceae bacterium]
MSFSPRFFTVPVEPEADEARDLLRTELSKTPYQNRGPNWVDQLIANFWDWLNNLSAPEGAGNFFIALILVVAVVALIFAAFLVFGKPRLNRKSGRSTELFGEIETRTASELRNAAAAAASQGNWNEAIVLQFRALALAMDERTIANLTPGTTAQSFAHRLGRSFPSFSPALLLAAANFDQVRY